MIRSKNTSHIIAMARVLVGICSLVLSICPEGILAEETASTFTDALKKGKAHIDLRYRLETVSDDAVPDENALASTLRTTLNYKTLTSPCGISAFVEFENVTIVGDDEGYNNAGAGSLWNGVTDKPVVADPMITEVNQAYVSITKIQDTQINIGRQELVLGNVRFVGNVGWRQNHQSYDALTFVNKSVNKTTLIYSYVHNVNRIFGDNIPMDAQIINAVVDANEHAKITGFTYLLDLRRNSQAGLSTVTLGGNISGSHTASDNLKILYCTELAMQSDFGDNPNSINANYYRFEGGAKIQGKLTVKAGYEVLSGNPTDGSFQTPLATLHAWNGWADKFLSTPTNGLKDFYISGEVKQGPFGMKAIYHNYTAEEGGGKYGSELDIVASCRTRWKQLFAFKMALYSADTHAFDTNKIMVFTTFSI